MKSIAERDSLSIWHPYTQMKNAGPSIAISHGKGSVLYAEDGKTYLDAISSWWTNLHGHAHPYISEKISRQLDKLEHVIFAGFTHEPAVQLAERLLSILPGKQSRVFYSDNGSTAVEVALKMAVQYWINRGERRKKIIAFQNAYHGDTFGAMSVSGRGLFTAAFNDMLFEVIHLPLPEKGKEAEAIDAFNSYLREHGNDSAAFIYEPLVQGAAGMVIYPSGPLDEILKACKSYDIVCIADEVMTGFGRCGPLFATELLTEKADIMCLSKGISGGVMAFGASTCNERIYEAFLSDNKSQMLFHGHSFTANPVACSAALASLDLLLDKNCTEQRKMIEHSHRAYLNKLHKDSPGLAARSAVQGTILRIDLGDSENKYLSDMRDSLYSFFIHEGILMRPLGNVIYILPPYCISPDELNYIYQKIDDLILKLSKHDAQPYSARNSR